MTHDEACQSLADSLRDQVSVGDWSQWIVCTEVEHDGNRFDVVAVNAWASRSEIRAYEVKVQQSDLARELRDGKWAAMRDAGASPYLALVPGLTLKRGDLPPGLGLVRLGRDSWRHEVRVERRKPDAAPRLIMAMLRKTRGEIGTLHRRRRLRALEQVTGEHAPSEAAHRAAEAAGHDLARWISDFREREYRFKAHEERQDERQKELDARETRLEELYRNPEMLEALAEARSLGIDVHAVKQVLDFVKASDDAWALFNTMLRLARRKVA